MFKILYGMVPNGTDMIASKLSDIESNADLRAMIMKMVAKNPDDRYQNVGEIIEEFARIVGCGLTSSRKYFCVVDYDKLNYLKKQSVVEQSMTMSILTNSFLKTQFRDCTAFYDEKSLNYVFTGKNVSIECIYDVTDKVFKIATIRPIQIDRKIRNDKRGFTLNGKLTFEVAGRYRSNQMGYNDNDSLIVDFQNNANKNQGFMLRTQKFDDFFGKWQNGIDEAMINEKNRVGRVMYSEYKIEDSRLLLTLDSYTNGNIDELSNEIHYVIEDETRKRQTIPYEIGNYSSVIYEDEKAILVLDFSPKAIRGKVKSLLAAHKSVVEDYRAKLSAYRRQSKAIKALNDDDYAAKNLKDILLTLETPASFRTLDEISFKTPNLNNSQKDAIRKVLYSESISLIQGPPGTGKTTVIKEIIKQIIDSDKKIEDPHRILIVSQSHSAVDNIVEGLIDFEDGRLDIIRIGKKEDLSEKVYENYAIESIRKGMYLRIKDRAEAYVREKDALFQGITNEDEIKRWGRIKDIQADWLNRCSNLDPLDYQVIKCATVIAGTCVGFLSNDFVRDLDFDYVIIDEAAKATTPELLVSIIKAQKIVLVGDQNQLPAYADQQISPTIADLTKNPKFRMFDVLFSELPESHKQILNEQYRMKRNIGDLISQVFYDNAIRSPIPDSEREHGIKMFEGKSIVWLDTSNMQNHEESNRSGGSFCNNAENFLIKKLLIKLRDDGELDRLDIGIITGYKGQKDLIRKTLTNVGLDKEAKKLVVNTLDAFQGQEDDVIIYSTVRTKRSIGFQKEKERVNVAFSRAKKLLIICGDLEFFYHFDDPNNKFIEIIDYIRGHEDECQIISGECMDGTVDGILCKKRN